MVWYDVRSFCLVVLGSAAGGLAGWLAGREGNTVGPKWGGRHEALSRKEAAGFGARSPAGADSGV